MEPPASFEAGAIRDEKAKVLRSMHPFESQELASRVVRGQYVRGSVGGETVNGYLEEPRSGRIDHRYLYRYEMPDRKLALVGCAVLYPSGKRLLNDY